MELLDDKVIAERLRELDRNADTELAHDEADRLLLEIVRHYGFAETSDAFEKMDKWYA